MEITFGLFLKNIGLSIAGLLGYGLFIYGKKLKTTNPRAFWKQHKHFILWAICVQILYSFVLALFPSLEIAVANWLIGIVKAIVPAFDMQISEENAVTVVYLLGGWLLSLWVKRTTYKKESNG